MQSGSVFKFSLRRPGAIRVLLLLVAVCLASIVWMVWTVEDHVRSWYAIVGITAVSLAGYFVASKYFHLAKLRQLSGRESLSFDQLYDRYYRESGMSYEAVHGLWLEIATTLAYEPGRLRPGDRFGVELKDYWLMDGETSQLSSIALERSRRISGSIDLSNIQTVDDYIRAFHSTWS